MKLERKNIYIDCEWTLDQNIYMIGYAYDVRRVYTLHDFTMNVNSFQTILAGVENIYCYGPDVGMLEKFFNVDLKTYYRCFNLLSIIKKIEPNLPSYKLADLEAMAGIQRTMVEYKRDIWQLHKDWKNPIKKAFAIKYNEEDVVNMIRVKNYFFQKNDITRKDIDQWRM